MYSQAKRDVGREWYKYMESIKSKADELLKAYEDAKLTDDKDLIKKTGKDYGQFLRQQTYMNKRYKSMLDTTTTKLANVNEIALSYLNDEMPSVYATNYNQVSKDMPAGISFDIVDENTVKNLVKDNPKLLPNKKLDIPKDKRWNQKAINAQVLQGIIQGESIDKMAKRLTPIMDRNKTSAIRNARTMTTSAQNKGRLDSYKAAQDNGVVLHKVWMATNSERTRAWHAALNGVEVDIDEPFENDYGEIMFPGDPDADPGNVYNCRCTMTTKIIGFMREDGSIKYIDGEELKDADENTFKVVDGKDISSTWKRRADEFNFEIEDVINAQGFDGKPRVVSAKEFDKYVKEANNGKGFIAQRAYSAPNQETLDAYRDQLYNGKWYVDCSNGGAAHGKGMYCVGNERGMVSEKMNDTMRSYGSSEFANIETFTIDKSAKFINEEDIESLHSKLAISEAEKYLSKYNFTDDELRFISAYRGVNSQDASFVGEFISNEKTSNRAMEIMKELSTNKELLNDTNDMFNDYLDIISDQSNVAVLFGYDGIKCRGGQDYYVILNRTKCIFKGE
jgi:SPP1 gp7 family putative phage head morphogenesis protein